MRSNSSAAALHVTEPGELWGFNWKKTFVLKRWKPLQLMVLLNRRATTLWLRNHIAPCIIRSVCGPSHLDDSNCTYVNPPGVWHTHLGVLGFERRNVGQSLIMTHRPSNYTLRFNPCHFHYLRFFSSGARSSRTPWTGGGWKHQQADAFSLIKLSTWIKK